MEEDDGSTYPRARMSLQPSDEARRSSYKMRRPKTRRSLHQRSRSHGNLNEESDFVFQQPAYDPDVFRQHLQQLPLTATGSDRRGWNTQMAVYVKRMGQRAGGYKWMHSQASRYFTKRFQWIGITAIIVNALATAGDIPYVTNCQQDLNWIKIIAIILGFLVTIAMAFQQFKDYGARSSKHTTSEANYAALYDHIQQQLRKNSRDRQDANDYVEWIAKELNDLKGASPLIPPGILIQYRQIVQGKNIADPEGVDEIIIKQDSPERHDDELLPSCPKTCPKARLVEVVVDDENNNNNRSGRLIVTYNDDAPPPE